MSVINLTLPYDELPVTGKLVTFIAPCNSDRTTHLSIHGEVYDLIDALGNPVSDSSFLKDAMVSVLLKVEDKKAFIQNSADSAKMAEHIKTSAYSEEGVHGIRMFEGKLQIHTPVTKPDGSTDFEWAEVISASTTPKPIIKVDTSGTEINRIFITDGSEVIEIEGVYEQYLYEIELPMYGVWTVYVSWYNWFASNKVTQSVYEDGVTYVFEWFSADLEVSTDSDSMIYADSEDGTVKEATSNGSSADSVYFYITHQGKYKVYATKEGVVSETKEVLVDKVNSYPSVNLSYYKVTVTSDKGSVILISNNNGFSNSKSIQNKSVTFYLPSAGVYEIWGSSPNGRTNSVSVTVSEYKEYFATIKYLGIYGVEIDLNNSDPESSVTYTDDAVGMIAGSSDWDSKPIFENIRPCAFKNGNVLYYLNPNNFKQKEDGTPANELLNQKSPEFGTDVMIEIPKIGFKIETIGDKIKVQVTDDPNASSQGFHYYAHTRDRNNEGDRDFLYIGAYLGYTTSYGAFSIMGQHPYHTSYTHHAHRISAQDRGKGYDLVSFYAYTLLQCLFLIRYKNLNSQKALGLGLTNYSEGTVVTGATFDKGMYYGNPNDATVQVKFMGIEDMWGNLSWGLDGVVSKPVALGYDNPVSIYTAFDEFTDYGTKFPYGDYESVGIIAPDGGISDSYLKVPQGTTELGFLPKETGASSTAYFCDVVSAKAGATRVMVGSSTSYKNQSGIFSIRLSGRGSYDYINGTRIMYL